MEASSSKLKGPVKLRTIEAVSKRVAFVFWTGQEYSNNLRQLQLL